MEENSSSTARFNILARTNDPIDAVVRHAEHAKLDFPAIASIELGFSEKYGYQVILVAYGSEGKWPLLIQTDYTIRRPRIEVPIPAGLTVPFLRELARNAREAYRLVKDFEDRIGR